MFYYTVYNEKNKNRCVWNISIILQKSHVKETFPQKTIHARVGTFRSQQN